MFIVPDIIGFVPSTFEVCQRKDPEKLSSARSHNVENHNSHNYDFL